MVYLLVLYNFTDTYAYSNAYYGQGTGPILLDSFHCTGVESSLLDCRYNHNSRSCSHSDDAGVRCPCKDLQNYPTLEEEYVENAMLLTLWSLVS